MIRDPAKETAEMLAVALAFERSWGWVRLAVIAVGLTGWLWWLAAR
ncbi:MAG: hypothetical protein QM704_16390 [Anaeromyxobacteraceae bacterium]